MASAGRRASSRCPHDVGRRYQICLILPARQQMFWVVCHKSGTCSNKNQHELILWVRHDELWDVGHLGEHIEFLYQQQIKYILILFNSALIMKSAGWPPAVCVRKIVASGGQRPAGRPVLWVPKWSIRAKGPLLPRRPAELISLAIGRPTVQWVPWFKVLYKTLSRNMRIKFLQRIR